MKQHPTLLSAPRSQHVTVCSDVVSNPHLLRQSSFLDGSFTRYSRTQFALLQQEVRKEKAGPGFGIMPPLLPTSESDLSKIGCAYCILGRQAGGWGREKVLWDRGHLDLVLALPHSRALNGA